MGSERIDVEALARAAVGRTLYTLDRFRPNEVLAISGNSVMVWTSETDGVYGSAVPLSVLQDAADRLSSDGKLELNPKTLGHRRSSFVGALLATHPQVVALRDPLQLRLRTATDLRQTIERALELIPQPRHTRVVSKRDPLFALFSRQLRDDVATFVNDEETYMTHGSTGQGNWAQTPWVGVFDLSVTDSATRGHYLVYLFKADGSAVFLSLNQGTTAVYNVERRRYRAALEAKAVEYESLLGPAVTRDLQTGPLDLGGGRPPLTPGYESGNVAAIAYNRGEVPDDTRLEADLSRMLELYSMLTERIDRVAEGASRAQSNRREELEEERYLRLHRRFEGRNTRAAKEAKRIQGYKCRGCGRDYVALYGEIGERCVDAHHRVPFAELGEGRRRLNPRRDFEILCAPCHRIVHSRREPLTIDELRAIVAL